MCDLREDHPPGLNLNDHDEVMDHIQWLHDQWCEAVQERNLAREELERRPEVTIAGGHDE